MRFISRPSGGCARRGLSVLRALYQSVKGPTRHRQKMPHMVETYRVSIGWSALTPILVAAMADTGDIAQC